MCVRVRMFIFVAFLIGKLITAGPVCGPSLDVHRPAQAARDRGPGGGGGPVGDSSNLVLKPAGGFSARPGDSQTTAAGCNCLGDDR